HRCTTPSPSPRTAVEVVVDYAALARYARGNHFLPPLLLLPPRSYRRHRRGRLQRRRRPVRLPSRKRSRREHQRQQQPQLEPRRADEERSAPGLTGSAAVAAPLSRQLL
ncbi:unnamed protein product, partial [Ectocarpus sp. 8 AP-2014]